MNEEAENLKQNRANNIEEERLRLLAWSLEISNKKIKQEILRRSRLLGKIRDEMRA